ncbi:MAG: hypothetical protein H8E36_16215 [Rhodospirillaceae bacterium]|nr:hypothetical protein [Rhodospirillaceae bacterium]
MQLSDPNWYFETYVAPPYRDYMDDKLKRHKAACAIVAVHHFWERLYEYYKKADSPYLCGAKRPKAFQKLLITKCPDLELLRIGANAIKHQVVDVPNDSKVFDSPQETATGYTSQDPIKISSSSVTHLTNSPARIKKERLVIDGTDGRTVAEVLTSVMNFWNKWLREHPESTTPT